MRTILLLEDDISLNRGITFKLKREGYKVISATTIEEGVQIFRDNDIDLIITDVGLEDGSGFDFCEKIREISNVYIIFLTALNQEVDIVTGYDLGADDYITKPFSLMVLISKVNAFMKRANMNFKGNIITSKDISLYLDELKVTKCNEEIILSKNEMKLLHLFMLNSGKVISREQVLSSLWDVDGSFVDKNTVAVNIRRLRQKIEGNPSEPEYIKNVRGIGYIWCMQCVIE